MGRFRMIRLSPAFKENLSVAVKSIKTNGLRSSLTIAIIAVGITCLVGILTAIEGLKSTVESNFAKMGTTSFYINSKYSEQASATRKRIKNRRNISYEQAKMFVENYDVPSIRSISCTINNSSTVKYGSEKTNPTISFIAADHHYIPFNLGDLSLGRNLNERDMESASSVCLIGENIRKLLFNSKSAVGEVITVSGERFQVVGVIAAVGQSMGGSLDNTVVIPITTARSKFINDNSFFKIGVIPESNIPSQFAYDEAERVFRQVRRLSSFDVSDFEIEKNDAMMSDFTKTMGIITIAASVIGLITLLGAAVGLMNIMLVSVKERTREIGTRKAMGATSKRIKQQFLMEAIVMGQLGGLFGITLGIIIGNVTALLMKASFVIPWLWMIIAILVCLGVSMASGYIPAKRAAALDPIEALRYE